MAHSSSERPSDQSGALPPGSREELAARLGAVRGRLRRSMLVEGFAWVVGGLVVMGIVGMGLDWLLDLSLGARQFYLVLTLGVAGFLFWRHVWGLFQLHLGPLDIAQALDRAGHVAPADALTPRVATVLERHEPGADHTGESPAMRALAIRRSHESLRGRDFTQRFSQRQAKRLLAIWYALLLVPLLIFVVAPGATGLAARRFLLGSNEPWPRNTGFTVVGLTEDGVFLVPRGEQALLRVNVADKKDPTERVSMQMTHSDGERETVSLTRFADGDFRYNLPPMQQPVTVRLRGGDGRFGPFMIEPVDRPRVTELKLTYRHLRDKEPVVHRFDQEEGNLRLLPDTAVELSWAANVPVSEVRVRGEGLSGVKIVPGDWIVTASADAPASIGLYKVPDTGGPRADENFLLDWTHCEPVQLRIEMISTRGGLSSYPVPVAVGLQQDRPPRLRLTHSIVRQRVTSVATIPLKLSGRDDFGITRIGLNTRIQKNTAALQLASLDGTNSVESVTNATTVYGPMVPAEEMRVEQEQMLDLELLELIPGDIIYLSGDVVDDCYAGMQTAHSRTLSFRVVVPEELFREILVRQQQLRARFRKAQIQAQELKEFLDTAVLPDDAARMIRDHRLIQREVWQVQRGLEASAAEMQMNRLGGEEALELIQRQVLEPMARLHDQTLTRQRDALESQHTQAAEPFESLVSRQTEIIDEFERILKNMAQWDSFIDVVNQLNTIIKIERKVNDETKVLGDKQIDAIFDD